MISLTELYGIQAEEAREAAMKAMEEKPVDEDLPDNPNNEDQGA